MNDISNADIFYYSGISAGILDENQKKQLIKVGTTAKVCAFDFNYRHQLHYDKNKSQSLFKEINNCVDVNFVSYDDFKELFNVKEPNEIFSILSNNKNMILLRYKNSIIFKNLDQEIKTITVAHGKAVDTTAAGDAFNGALSVAISQNKNYKEAIEFANLVAGVSVTREGAANSMPYKEELL